MDKPTEQPVQARCVVIGVYQLNDHTELRFVKEPWGWRPDLVVNMATEEVSAPPSCFKPDEYVVACLDAAWEQARQGPILMEEDNATH